VYVLGSNPIGELGQELVYLRIRELRQPGVLVLLIVLIELVELSFPFMEWRRYVRDYSDLVLYMNTAQAILVLVATVLVLLVVRRYTHRALDRRIRESMETLANLEGQRRRRRAGNVERREWEPREEE
jgi:membrane protein implicated in regulation of membrane protease activity